ncbi:MAG: cytochrome c [Pseudomonadota bacterium]
MKHLLIIVLIQVVFTATAFAGNPASGEEKSATCAACHGPDGMSPTPEFPNIAGQYEDYLYQSLKDYKSGERNNAIMAGTVATLSDQDMKDLAAYYASLPGLTSLSLPKK